MRSSRRNCVNLLDESSDEEISVEQNINIQVGIDNHLYPDQNTSQQNQIISNEIKHQTPIGGRLISQEELDYQRDECVERIVLPSANIYNFKHNVPLDQSNYTYLIFYLLGITTMCPWNFFVTAEDYWMYKFRNVTENCTTHLTPMQKSFTSDLTVTASISGTIFLILNATYGHLVSLKLKMIGSMFIILTLFIFTTCFVEVNTDDWQGQFFLLTLGTVVIINSLSATMSGGLFGIAGLFPSEYMTAVVSGQALGGIFTALAFIMALTFGASPKTTAFVYFSIGNAILIISIITYIIMSRTIYFRYYVHDKINTSRTTSTIDNEFNENLDNLLNDNIFVPNLKLIFNKIYLYVVIECLVMATSLSVYPAVTVLVESENHGNGHKWNDVYFLPVANYLAFNSGDYLGRILAGLWEAPKNNPDLILLFTILRFGFIPCFMLANQNHIFLPAYITSDITFIILILIFAISNGYLANIALINVPKIVNQHEKEMASSIMAASLSLGLAIGSCFSMFIVQIL